MRRLVTQDNDFLYSTMTSSKHVLLDFALHYSLLAEVIDLAGLGLIVIVAAMALFEPPKPIKPLEPSDRVLVSLGEDTILPTPIITFASNPSSLILKLSCEQFPVVFSFLAWLHQNVTINVKLDPTGDLFLALASRAWDWYQFDDMRLQPQQKDEYTYALTSVISAFLQESGDRGSKKLASLFSEHDFLALLEKAWAFQATQHVLVDDPVWSAQEKRWRDLLDVLSKHGDTFRTPLRRDYLSVVDYFRTLRTAGAAQVLQYWEELGRIAGVKEDALRLEDAAMHRISEDIIGCSWFKCVVYRQQIGRTVVLVCSRCRKAAYCSELCQDKHWKEGGHSMECKKTK